MILLVVVLSLGGLAAVQALGTSLGDRVACAGGAILDLVPGRVGCPDTVPAVGDVPGSGERPAMFPRDPGPGDPGDDSDDGWVDNLPERERPTAPMPEFGDPIDPDDQDDIVQDIGGDPGDDGADGSDDDGADGSGDDGADGSGDDGADGSDDDGAGGSAGDNSAGGNSGGVDVPGDGHGVE